MMCNRRSAPAGTSPFVFALLFVALQSPAQAATPTLQPSVWAAKPDVAAFQRRVDEYLASAEQSVEALIAVTGPRTVENTLQRYDDALRNASSAAYLASTLEYLHPEAPFRDRAVKANVKASAFRSQMQLDPRVYRALADVDLRNADAATRNYVERQLRLFRLAGVDKDESTRAEIKKVNEELTELVAQYDRNISDDVRYIDVTQAELSGLPADYVASRQPDTNGRIQLTTAYPDAYPVITYAEDAELRRRMIKEFENRGYPANRAVLRALLVKRERIARSLGYAHWADYYAADKMIGTGAGIGEFIETMASASKPTAEREWALLLAEKRKTDPAAATISIDEVAFLRERVRRARFEFDSQSVRPYFPYERVKQGVLGLTAEMFHVAFEREFVPGWHPSVETWLVREGDEVIGRIYLDMHPREGKFTHAAMIPVLDGVAGRQLPEVALMCNFATPTATDPGLLSYDEVKSFLHEFGHLVHHVVAGKHRWAGISGISMEWDFVEAPSQMLEELVHNPEVLQRFARHYQTGEPIPRDLVERMNRAYAFGRGIWVSGKLVSAAVSFDLHRLPAVSVDFDSVWQQNTDRHYGLPRLPDTHGWASFGPLAGYSSTVYAYLWGKVIALDFYRQFDADNPLSGDAGMRYRRTVLEPGGSRPANDLVRTFLGRPVDPTVLKRWVEEGSAPAQ